MDTGKTRLDGDRFNHATAISPRQHKALGLAALTLA